jgi:outer membrane protein
MSINILKYCLPNYLHSFLVICLLLISTNISAQNLLEIYDLALQNDPILKQALDNQLANGESKNQSIANFLPKVSAVGIANQNRLVNDRATYQSAGIQSYLDKNLTVNLVQPLFHFDHWIKLSLSENQIAQAEADYQNEFQKLIVKVAEAYFNILSAEDNLEYTREEKQAIARQLEQSKQRYALGLVDITDVLLAQAAYDKTIANEIEAINIVDNQKEALGVIIGDQDIMLNDMGEHIPLSRPIPDDITAWSDSAELSNYSIISAFNQMETSRKTIDVQRNGHLPTLDLNASLGQYQTNSSFGLQGSQSFIGMTLNVPIFQGGMVNSTTQQASYKYEQAKENLTAIKRDINRQVKNAYRGILTSMGRVDALKTTVDAAETVLQATQVGYDTGTKSLIDVMNAQKNLYSYKRDYAKIRYDYLLNSLKLKQAASNLTEADLLQINQLLVTGTMPKRKIRLTKMYD